MADFPTHFNALRVGSQQAGGSRAANIGKVVASQTATVAFTDTAAKDLFTLPAGAQILDVLVDVTTAFDAGDDNDLDIGKDGAAAHFVNDADVSAAGRVTGTRAFANWADIGSADVTVTATYVPDGAAATAGAARITVVYAY